MNREGIIYLLLIWIVVTAAYLAAVLFYFDLPGYYAWRDTAGMCMVMAMGGFSLHFTIRYIDKGLKSATEVVVSHLAAATLLVLLFSVLGKWVSNAIAGLPEEQISQLSIARIGTSYMLYMLVALQYYSSKYRDTLLAREKAEAELKTSLREAELNLLKSQLNPHFIFNSLNSISSLIITRPEQAREMVIGLSDFLRYSLGKGKSDLVKLEEELLHLEQFVQIEKVRYGDRLIWKRDVPSEVMPMKVPSLILQPLVENAIKFGMYDRTEKGEIRLHVRQKGKMAEFMISNPTEGGASVARGAGMGIRNVIERLELIYFGKALLNTEEMDGTFVVRLKIPVRDIA